MRVLKLRASWALAGAIAVVHLAGAVCVLLLLPQALGWALALLVLVLGGVTLRDRALLRASGSVCGLELRAEGAAILVLADGRRLPGVVAPRRYVGRGWVYLQIAGTPRRRLLVVRDMLDAADFRALRLWALWDRVPGMLSTSPHLAPGPAGKN